MNEGTRNPFPFGQVGSVLVLVYIGWTVVAMIRAFNQLLRDDYTDLPLTPPLPLVWIFNVGLLMMLAGYVRAGRKGRWSKG
jgi:hypothetical protein